MGIRGAAAGVMAAALLAASTATAQDVQNFDPAVGTWNYFSVEGARTAAHQEFVPSLYINYGAKPLVLRDAETDEEIAAIVDQLGTLDLLGTIGLFDRVEIGLRVPLNMVYGTLDGRSDEGFALGDISIIPKVRLFGLENLNTRGVGVALAVPMTLPTGDQDKFVGAGQFTINPKLILEGHFGSVRLAANAGARVRPDKRVVRTLDMGHEFTYGAGVDLDIADDYVHLLAEVFGAAPLTDIQDDSASSPLELLAGARIFLPPGPVFTLGAGFGLIPDYGSPDYRVILGFAFDRRDLDRDGDGILDYDDQCPDDPEDKDEFQDADGCPDPDNDQDGILDVDDKCPLDPEDRDGFEDADGCPDPDNDKDGILDVNDKCPDDPETFNEWQDEDGCPDEIPDTDGDGLKDNVDQCPNDPEDFDGFKDEDGCPDPDNDRDGILDVDDKCPNEPEVINGVDDDDGCPDEGKVQVKLTEEKIEIYEKIYFELDKAIIRPISFSILDQVVRVVVRNPQIKRLRIEGHTDSQGTDAYNMDLSQRRADAVMKYLVTAGVDPGRLEAVGYGESRPIETNDTKEGRATNRRVEFTILEQDKPAE
ncbi:MAG: OmpA family protein [Myxococcales bacterium]|nr:OmpA family protein [Myxococcales bacterium]